jgi:hypothetical protein
MQIICANNEHTILSPCVVDSAPPHGQLFGLTPAEAYGRKIVNFKMIRKKMIDAHHKKIRTTRLMRIWVDIQSQSKSVLSVV